MLFLLCQLGAQRYAIDANQIAEILPLVAISEMARAPEEVAGIFVYRGAPVPVIDLSRLLEGRPAVRRLSTRVVMLRYPIGNGDTRLLGLVVEKATETIRRQQTDFVESGVSAGGARYLGPIATDPRGLIQRVDVAKLLNASGRALFDQ